MPLTATGGEWTIGRLSMDSILNRFFPESESYRWQMELCERAVLETLLRRLEPEIGIEVGTADGGSLSATSPFTKQFYSLDVKHSDELKAKVANDFPHVELVTGDSRETLPKLLQQIEENDQSLGYVLIDGGHSRELVCADMTNVIQHRPKEELFLVGHDSFNPNCRQGMLEVDWASSPWVHHVEIDAVPGILWGHKPIELQQWGGFIMVHLKHEAREGDLEITQRQQLKQSILSTVSTHRGGLMDSLKMCFGLNKRRKQAGS